MHAWYRSAVPHGDAFGSTAVTEPARIMAARRGGEVDRPRLADRVRHATREMERRRLLVGPDRSINPDTPERPLDAGGAAIRGDTT